MNCANHPDTAAIAYCRTCGKPLCSRCTRDVKGVIYCENCLADRLAGAQPTVTPPTPGVVSAAPVGPTSGPNPALAGVLAGFFPFGVGAVYCGQYAKGLAHLLIFFGLIYGVSNAEGVEWLFGIGIAFFYVWQIIDAVRTAHAVSAGQPAPDPLGLGQTFGAGDKVDTAKIPVGAIVLIGLGALLMLQTAGVFEFSSDQMFALILMLLGGWLLAKRLGMIPSKEMVDHANRTRRLSGPVFLMTLGAILFVEHIGGPRFHRTWPLLFLALGITKLLERQGPTLPPPALPGSSGPGSTGAAGGEVQPPVTEVRNG